MSMRMTFAAGAILAILAFVGWPLAAQQAPRAAAVTTASGIQVEEVRVGGSCVVVVSRGGPGPNTVAAVPCR